MKKTNKMDVTKFKKLKITTSRLGFGCMRFPTNDDGTINEVEAEAMIDYAMEHGVNYYDTAYPYHNGQSEVFLGKILDIANKNDIEIVSFETVGENNDRY